MAITRLGPNQDITAAKIAGTINFKNLIINGDMSIAQRGTSSTGITSNGYYTVDRFQTIISGLGTWTNSQSTDVPTGQGFSNSLKMECTTADASPSAGDNLLLYHYVEAQNCQHLKFGTSNAESLTLSFWVKSNKTGTLTQNIRQIDGGKFINNSYTINSANTWEKKTLNFVGNTADVIDNDNGAGFQIEWWLDSGSNFRGGTPSSSWHTQNNLDRNADGTISLADTVGNTWYITGVQLEVGTSASDFEFLPYDVNLQRCKRYYEMISDGRLDPDGAVATAMCYQTNVIALNYQWFPKRATPSISQVSGTNFFRFQRSGGVEDFNSIKIYIPNATTGLIYSDDGVTATTGQVGWVNMNSTTGYVALNAEL
jgi:hypothetical protein